jgi:hypothetical protein
MRLTFHAWVQREANEAVRWYDEQKHGLGDDFFGELIHALDHAAASPECFSFWLESAASRTMCCLRFARQRSRSCASAMRKGIPTMG